MVICAAYKCKSRSERKEPNITFHRFPTDPERKNRWVREMKIPDWAPTPNERLCSKHFEPRFFYLVSDRRRLLNGAVPTIFAEFPKDMQRTKTRKRALPETLSSASAVSTSQLQGGEETLQKKRIRRHFQQVAKSQKKPKIINVILKQKLKRCKRQIKSLTLLMKELNQKNLLSSENVLLFTSMPNFVNELQKHKLKMRSIDLRKFAVTLSFFSPKAYDYVRQVFDTCLPHRSAIGNWFKSINAEPGFTKESSVALKRHVEMSDKPVVLSLIVDEISLRQQLEWDGERYRGYVDCGVNLDSDVNELAKEAFVLMVVAVNGTWTLPVGYFFTSGLSGIQKSAIVSQCSNLIVETGAHLLSLTLNGTPSNIAMTHILGCKTEFDNMKPYFTSTGQNTYIFFDPGCMLKLIRTTFQEKKVLKDGDGNLIKWEYIENLINLHTERLHLGNELEKVHLNFKEEKLLTESVADTLSYCEEELDLNEFKGCHGTVKFIKTLNNIFDVLSSRSLVPAKYKKALFEDNFESTQYFIQQSIEYISNLKLISDEFVIHSTRKTGFIGFIVSMRSALMMYDDIVCQQKKLVYLPLYRASQDHLESFFSSMHKSGRNISPTCCQFTACYKRLLIKTEIS